MLSLSSKALAQIEPLVPLYMKDCFRPRANIAASPSPSFLSPPDKRRRLEWSNEKTKVGRGNMWQEGKKEKECCWITLFVLLPPIRMTSSHNMYFHWAFNSNGLDNLTGIHFNEMLQSEDCPLWCTVEWGIIKNSFRDRFGKFVFVFAFEINIFL